MTPPSEHWLARTLKLRGYTRGALLYHGRRTWVSRRVKVVVGDDVVSVELLPVPGDDEAWKVDFTGAPPRPVVRLVLDVAEMADTARAEEIAREIEHRVIGDGDPRG